MVSSIGFSLGANRRITGFGRRRVPVTRGRGVIRRTLGSIARVPLTFIANKVADLISGSGKRRTYRKRSVRGSSFKLSGAGRKPRRKLQRKVGGLRRKRVVRIMI